MIARTNAAPLESPPSPRTKDRSIFNSSKGSLYRYWREEYPVPKSSIANPIPDRRNSRIFSMVPSTSSKLALSVSSSLTQLGEIPFPAITLLTQSTKSPARICFALTFIESTKCRIASDFLPQGEADERIAIAHRSSSLFHQLPHVFDDRGPVDFGMYSRE